MVFYFVLFLGLARLDPTTNNTCMRAGGDARFAAPHFLTAFTRIAMAQHWDPCLIYGILTTLHWSIRAGCPRDCLSGLDTIIQIAWDRVLSLRDNNRSRWDWFIGGIFLPECVSKVKRRLVLSGVIIRPGQESILHPLELRASLKREQRIVEVLLPSM